MTTLQNNITRIFQHTNEVLVFSTEILASSWYLHVAKHCAVARGDRFISWDTFKKNVFLRKETKTPTNTLIRSIFAQYILQKNAKDNVLSTIVPPDFRYDINLHSSNMESLLSKLSMLIHHKKIVSIIGKKLFNDLKYIYVHYENFLNTHNYYEPAWHTPTTITKNLHYCIVHPELLDDFHKYEQVLKEAPNVRWLSLGETPVCNHIKYYEFDDYRKECYQCLEKIGELLHQGVHPEEIAITLANYEELYPRFNYLARNLGIPLSRRKGKPLSSYLSISWLVDLSNMAKTYSFKEVRRFLLHPSLLWKDPTSIRKLILMAIDQGLVEGGLNAWKRLTQNKKENVESPTYTGLFQALQTITQAQNMETIITTCNGFLSHYTHHNSWHPDELSAWKQGMNILQELAHILHNFQNIKINPLSFAVSILSSTIYQPLTQEGIPVYNYKVSTGIPTKYHFCLNFNASSTIVIQNNLSFLRDEQQQQLFPYATSTSHFLKGYHTLGNYLWISYGKHSNNGEVLPPECFLQTTNIQDTCETFPKYKQAIKKIYPWQYKVHLMSHHQCAEIIQEYTPIKTSVSKLESWIHCPFGYLWSEKLKIQEQALSPALLPAEKIGNLLHKVMERTYKNICNKIHNTLSESQRENYRKIACETINEIFKRETIKDWELLQGIPLLFHEFIRKYCIKAVAKVLNEDTEHFHNCNIYNMEMNLKKEISQNGQPIHLTGKIDCIMQKPNGNFIIIDYKTGNTIPTIGKILGSIKDNLPPISEQKKMDSEDIHTIIRQSPHDATSIQLPAYSLLLKEHIKKELYDKQEAHVTTIAYYSLPIRGNMAYIPRINILPEEHEDTSKNFIIYKTGNTPNTNPVLMEVLEQSVIERLEKMKEHITQGKFCIPSSGCPQCNHKSICRYQFVVSMDKEK